MNQSFFATTPRGLEPLLAGELHRLEARHVRQARAGVSFEGDLRTAYRVCLWSRLATRVLMPLTNGPAGDGEELYATARSVDWGKHLDVGGTLAVDFSGTSDAIRDTRFGAVRIKDAIVDQFRESNAGRRPSVDARRPDLRVNGHLVQGRLTVSLDLGGESLHRRGYRTDKVQVEAPLKENLAAAVLLFAAWPQEAEAGGSLLDPLCGSGTLPIEAALIAADVAPGLVRAEAGGFAFSRGRRHDAAAWDELVAEARERRAAGLGRLAAAAPGQTVSGCDRDARAVDVALACVRRAGLQQVVAISRRDLGDVRSPAPRGLLVANLPYGQRLGGRDEAEALTEELGGRLRREFPGWCAALLTGSHEQARAAALIEKREAQLRNGPLECTLVYGEVTEGGAARGSRTGTTRGGKAAAVRASDAGPAARRGDASTTTGGRGAARLPATAAAPRDTEATRSGAPAEAGAGGGAPLRSPRAEVRSSRGAGMLGGGAEQFANRLHKNLHRLRRQLRREGITCYRAYDADLPEYNFVVDVYGDWVHVQEYAAPAEVDPTKAARRLEDALAVVGAVLEAPPERVVLKQRRRQRGAAQYERRARSGALFPVTEDDLTYLVNLTDYLDTGLFVDQRLTRRLLRSLAGGRRFLNLFAYTGTMTVDALAGGSPASTTVDLSATYLEWARRNLEANGFTAALELSGDRGGGWGDQGGDRGGGRGAGEEQRGHAVERRGPTADARAQHAGARGRDAGRHDSRAGQRGGSALAGAAPASSPHRLVQADCLRWPADDDGQYDLIWLDPPTFSNSKRMGRATFDVQRDHADLLRMAARRLLAPGGVLLFATNRRGFRLDRDDLTGLTVTDLSRSTLPFDCTRAANRHHVFRLEHTSAR